MAYDEIHWENLPSTATPRGATNFNRMDKGIKDAHRLAENVDVVVDDWDDLPLGPCLALSTEDNAPPIADPVAVLVVTHAGLGAAAGTKFQFAYWLDAVSGGLRVAHRVFDSAWSDWATLPGQAVLKAIADTATVSPGDTVLCLAGGYTVTLEDGAVNGETITLIADSSTGCEVTYSDVLSGSVTVALPNLKQIQFRWFQDVDVPGVTPGPISGWHPAQTSLETITALPSP